MCIFSCLLQVWIVSISATDCLERLESEMTDHVSCGTLNSAHSKQTEPQHCYVAARMFEAPSCACLQWVPCWLTPCHGFVHRPTTMYVRSLTGFPGGGVAECVTTLLGVYGSYGKSCVLGDEVIATDVLDNNCCLFPRRRHA